MVVPILTKTIRFLITIPANVAANSVLTGSNAQIIDDPLAGPLSELQVPVTQAWVIKDIYVKTSPAIDVIVRVKKNRFRVVYPTPPVSALLVSNPSRPKTPAIYYGPGEVISIEAINLAAGGANATTVEVYADVDIYGSL